MWWVGGFWFSTGPPRGLEELNAILNGNILWISGREVFEASLLYLGHRIVSFHLPEALLCPHL
ncbi:MAG: hypothetical protein A4E57_04621 [Syntrophorhabdaceae bacterium PtaU1.Bin034]|nr:MAG: hypothetical protein A4E57_04621 [Syntrophorhabdaceae bacterium PtaU1.Bin034]